MQLHLVTKPVSLFLSFSPVGNLVLQVAGFLGMTCRSPEEGT